MIVKRNLRADGETGRRTTLKMWHRKVWEFDSPSAHLNAHKFFSVFENIYIAVGSVRESAFTNWIGRRMVKVKISSCPDTILLRARLQQAGSSPGCDRGQFFYRVWCWSIAQHQTDKLSISQKIWQTLALLVDENKPCVSAILWWAAEAKLSTQK